MGHKTEFNHIKGFTVLPMINFRSNEVLNANIAKFKIVGVYVAYTYSTFNRRKHYHVVLVYEYFT